MKHAIAIVCLLSALPSVVKGDENVTQSTPTTLDQSDQSANSSTNAMNDTNTSPMPMTSTVGPSSTEPPIVSPMSTITPVIENTTPVMYVETTTVTMTSTLGPSPMNSSTEQSTESSTSVTTLVTEIPTTTSPTTGPPQTQGVTTSQSSLPTVPPQTQAITTSQSSLPTVPPQTQAITTSQSTETSTDLKTTPLPTTPTSTSSRATTSTTTKTTSTTSLTTRRTTNAMKTTTTTAAGGNTDKNIGTTIQAETAFGRVGLPLFAITLAILICVLVGICVFIAYQKRNTGTHYISENGRPDVMKPMPMVATADGVGMGSAFETIDLEEETKPRNGDGTSTGFLSFGNPGGTDAMTSRNESQEASQEEANAVNVEQPSWLRVEPSNMDDTASNFSTQAQTDDREVNQEVDDIPETSGEISEPTEDYPESDKESVNSSAVDEEDLPPPPPEDSNPVQETEM